jgi:hypothetical protein
MLTVSQNASELLSQLSPKTFYFDTTNVYGLNFSSKLQYGLIAQEVEQVIPSLIDNNYKPATVDTLGQIVTPSVNYKTMNYTGLIPLLVRASQEQMDSIITLKNSNDSLANVVSDLNTLLTTLENCLSALLPSLCQMNQQLIQSNTPAEQEQARQALTVRLSNKESIILDQNVPNPFAEQTVINFSIPASVQKAQLHFYNAQGRIIQSMDIAERGLGSVTVFGADLSSGIYTYSLVADGQVVATKKMMKN